MFVAVSVSVALRCTFVAGVPVTPVGTVSTIAAVVDAVICRVTELDVAGTTVVPSGNVPLTV